MTPTQPATRRGTVIELEDAAIGRGLSAAVPALTLAVTPGAPTVIAVETDERPMLVSMLLGGRLRPDTGRVLVNGLNDLDTLRLRTALVDTPVVSEPTAGVSLAAVIAEELSFSGAPSSRRAVKAFLGSHGLAEYASIPMRTLPTADRIRLFCELALLRRGVDSLIITSPERHGGDSRGWYPGVAAIAERGITVAIVTDAATASTLVALGARDSLDSLDPAPVPES